MKFRSYGFWTALAGAVTLLVGAISKCFGFNIDGADVGEVIMALAGVLVVLGIVIMPTGEKNKEDSEKNDDENDDKNEASK